MRGQRDQNVKEQEGGREGGEGERRGREERERDGKGRKDRERGEGERF